MQVNNENKAPETGTDTLKAPQIFNIKDASELKSDGRNTEVLSVRISPELLGAVHKMAEVSARPVPEMVRALLMFHLLPTLLKSAANKMLTDDSSVGIAQKLYFDANRARKHLVEVNATIADARRRLDAVESMSLKADANLAAAEAAASEAWDKYIEQLKDYHEALETVATTDAAPVATDATAEAVK